MLPLVNGISSSDLMELTSTTREERFLMSQEELIKKDNMLLLMLDMERLTRDGASSMSIKHLKKSLKVSTREDSMSIDLSILSQECG